MELCWDNLENIRYIKKTGNFKLRGLTYYIYDNCAECGNSFLGKKQAIYCSKKCSGKNCHMVGKHHTLERRQKLSISNSGKNHWNWKGGISKDNYCDVWRDSEYKEIFIERDGTVCNNPLCVGEKGGLTRHHIDYNKENCNPNNIIVICRSCNSKSNHNRDWWQIFFTEIMENKNGRL